MRVNTPFEAMNRNGFVASEGIMTGPLTLPGDPELGSHAATKAYADSILSNLDVSYISGGVLDNARLGEFTGDLVNNNGSIELSPTGITAGVYVKVTVNSKGRVVSQDGALLTTDIPDLSWGKLSGTPTTLAGYGITGVLTKAGGEMIGSLTSEAYPYDRGHAMTKQQSEELVDSYRISVGDIVRKPVDVTPAGFLRCNGGIVSKEMYSELWSVCKEGYKGVSVIGGGKPWKQQYDINTGNGTIGAWSTATGLPGVLSNYQAIVTKNRVYLLGGFNGSTHVNTVYTAPINEDGTLGTWSTATTLPGALAVSQAIVTKNRVYLMGGSNGSVYVNTVYTAPINEDGTLGVWSTATGLPGALGISQAIVTKNRVYLMGGYNGSAHVNTVYTAPINEDGTIGVWSTATGLPEALLYSQAIVTKNRVYLMGGVKVVWNEPVTTVYSAPLAGGLNDYSQYYDGSTDVDLERGMFDNLILPGSGKPWKQQYDINTANGTIGTWSTATGLPGALVRAQAIVTKNRVYLMGGSNGSVYVNTVYTAPINEDGTIGTWSTATGLPEVLGISQAIVTKNRVYLLGGSNGSVYVNNVYTAPINEDGTLGAWSTATSLPGALAASQAIVTKNRVYLMGGHNETVYVNTVYTAPINEDGTLGTWSTATSLPGILEVSQAIVTKNRVYLMGGSNGSVYVNTVYTAPINEDGTIGAWSTATSLPGALGLSQAIVTKNRVYLMGGVKVVWNEPVTTVYSAPLAGGLNDYSQYYNPGVSSNSFVGMDASKGISVGSGRPWENQYSMNKTYSDIGAWSETVSPTPEVIGGTTSFVTKNRVYLAGGRNNSGTVTDKIKTAVLNQDGTLGAWSDAGVMSWTYSGSQFVLTKERVFMIGGSFSAAVESTEIQEDGTLGAWVAEPSLPVGLIPGPTIAHDKYVMVFGGLTTGVSDTNIYVSEVNIFGNLSGWSLVGTIPEILTTAAITVIGNKVFLIGGQDGAIHKNTVYSAELLGNGNIGSWTTNDPLPGTFSQGKVVTVGHKVYLMAGFYNSEFSNVILEARIDVNGNLGTWTVSPNLTSEVMTTGTVFVANNHVYVTGGSNGGVSTTSVLSASLNGAIQDYTTAYDTASTIISTEPKRPVGLLNTKTHFTLPNISEDYVTKVNSYIKFQDRF